MYYTVCLAVLCGYLVLQIISLRTKRSPNACIIGPAAVPLLTARTTGCVTWGICQWQRQLVVLVACHHRSDASRYRSATTSFSLSVKNRGVTARAVPTPTSNGRFGERHVHTIRHSLHEPRYSPNLHLVPFGRLRSASFWMRLESTLALLSGSETSKLIMFVVPLYRTIRSNRATHA